MTEVESRVYFIQCGEHIKIGVARDVPSRMRDLNNGAPEAYVLLGAAAGDRKTEGALHRFLSDFRTRGEWFRDCAEVRAAMVRLQSEGPAFLIGEKKPERKRRPLPMPGPKPTHSQSHEEWLDEICGENKGANLMRRVNSLAEAIRLAVKKLELGLAAGQDRERLWRGKEAAGLALDKALAALDEANRVLDMAMTDLDRDFEAEWLGVEVMVVDAEKAGATAISIASGHSQ